MGYVGTYDRTIFYNPGNKYCIISVKTSDQSVPQQARSAYRHRDNMIRFIAVGYELPQTDKVSMILDGEWENGKHGVQLQVDKCEEIVPQTKEGVYGYLSSRLIKGVGEKTAALIVNRFGADALRVLENEPERLLEIRGITPDKLEDIKCRILQPRTKSAALMKRPKPSAKPSGSKNSVKKPKLNRLPGKTPWLWVMMRS